MVIADIKTKILAMVPVAVAIILLGLANNIEFEDGFSPTDLQIINFEYRHLSIQEKQAVAPVNILQEPLDYGRLGPDHEISDIDAKSGDIEVSLIIVSGNRKMAIIQGVIVKEGDVIEGKRVVKIESKRVLLNDGENKWIYVKE